MVSFNISEERLEKIDHVIKLGKYPNRTAFINTSIDFFFNYLESRYVFDFMYLIALPLFFFIVSVGLTLYLTSLFFYVLSGVSGLYLTVFIYLFYDKYKKVKHASNNK